MYYEHNIQGCFSEKDSPSILKTRAFEVYIEKAKDAARELLEDYRAEKLGVLNLLKNQDDIHAILPIASHYQHAFEDVVILGTGGSSLGGQTLSALRGFGESLSVNQPRLHFLDNIDPLTFNYLFKTVNPKRTGFIVISKSGATSETLCQFLIVLKYWKEVLTSKEIKTHFLVITEPRNSPLSQLAKAEGIETLSHPLAIGGRFSVLSLVGLLPAMIAGVDGFKVRQGAESTFQRLLTSFSAEPLIGAALHVALLKEKNISNTVLMPYRDCLKPFSFWFRQLWAESLGKNNKGLTPLNALGTVDQHSQLQLYLDGPKDKMFTIIICDSSQKGEPIPQKLPLEDLSYLAGRSMGELLEAEQQATITTLINRKCPTRIISLKEMDEHALGALLMHFILETILTAKLLNVNAFDQPAVEEGKILTRKILEERVTL